MSGMVKEMTRNKRGRSFTNTTQDVGDMLPESEWNKEGGRQEATTINVYFMNE